METNPNSSNIVERPENGTADGWKIKIKEEQDYWRDWREQGRDILSKFRGPEGLKVEKATGRRKFAILWSNTEVLKTAVYAKAPEPQVSRRFKDKDPVGRIASEALERCLVTSQDIHDDNGEYIRIRDDLLLPGRGAGRVRYDAKILRDEEGNPIQVQDEKALFEHYHFEDFIHGRARHWKKVPWVAFASWLTKDQWDGRFKNKDGSPIDFIPSDSSSERGNKNTSEEVTKANEGKARVWEIWDKISGKVIWVCESYHDILEESPPPINFRNFFPCPKPVYATMTNDSLVPIPDYKYYEDQARQVDELTSRISKLTAALKVVGFYPGGDDNSGSMERAFKSDTENVMIPINSWAAFTDKGGSSGAIQWLPIEVVSKTLNELIALRRQMIDDIYQITGISDILRGATQASETATAQQIKAEWGGVRIRDKQAEIERFGRDVQELKSEIISEVFSIDSIKSMSGLQLPTQEMKEKHQLAVEAYQREVALMQEAAQVAASRGEQFQPPQPPMPPEQPTWLNDPTWEDVKTLLEDERLRGFRVDVETDSTIMQDAAVEKAARNEFLAAVGSYIQQAMPIVLQAPQIADVVGEMLLFTVRGYRAGRELEEKVEEAVEQLKAMAQQSIQAAANPEPDPLMEAETRKVAADAADKEASAAKKQAEAQKIMQPDAPEGMTEADQIGLMHKTGELVLQKKKLDAANEDRAYAHAERLEGEVTKQEQAKKGALDDILRMLETLDARLDKIEAKEQAEEERKAPKISDALSA